MHDGCHQQIEAPNILSNKINNEELPTADMKLSRIKDFGINIPLNIYYDTI